MISSKQTKDKFSVRLKRSILISNVMSVVFGSVFFVCLCLRPSKNDKEQIPSAMAAATTGQQARQQVQKDLWISQSAGTRVHDHIESDSSTLVFRPKHNAIEVIEQLQGVRGWIRERNPQAKTADSLQLRYFVAKEGTYFYKDQDFRAFNVLLSLYKNDTDPSPFLKGTAKELHFSLEEGVPVFQATQFSASLPGGFSKP